MYHNIYFHGGIRKISVLFVSGAMYVDCICHIM